MINSIKIDYDAYDEEPLRVFLNDEQLSLVDKDNSPTGKEGMMKEVFVGEKHVVKFASMEEADLDIDPDDRKYFALVVLVDIDRRWYVQERVDCVPFAEVTEEDLNTVLDLADKYGFDDVDFCYRSTENRKFGHNFTKDRFGQVKIYDYEGA